jgi:dTDP-4-dehydrorhamnose reductase
MSILIFGSTGMLGGYMHKIISNKYKVYTLNRENFNPENKDWKLLKDLIYQFEDLEAVVNCIGIIPHRKKNIKSYFLVNTVFPHKLSEICVEKNIKLIHISSDCIFSGNEGNYNEENFHTAEDIYGRSKSLGENDKMCIIRTSIIGEEKYNKKGLLEWLKSSRNKQINGYLNHLWNGVTCLELSKVILNIIEKKLYWTGARHIFSETITKHDLCRLISDIYDLNLKIKSFYTKKERNMTLYTLYEKFKVKSLKDQIIEMRNFKLE